MRIPDATQQAAIGRRESSTQIGNMVVSVSTNLSKPCGEAGGSGNPVRSAAADEAHSTRRGATAGLHRHDGSQTDAILLKSLFGIFCYHVPLAPVHRKQVFRTEVAPGELRPLAGEKVSRARRAPMNHFHRFMKIPREMNCHARRY